MFLIGGMLQSSLLLNCLVQCQSHQLHFVTAFHFRLVSFNGFVQVEKYNTKTIVWELCGTKIVLLLWIFCIFFCSGLIHKDYTTTNELQEIRTTSGKAFLYFYSDAAYNMSGFNITYR